MKRHLSFKGHPKGLSTLYFTELWERFSYYGMRAILILYMVAPLRLGGLQFNVKHAAAVYGIYTMSVYLLGLPGGYIADHYTGAKKAVGIGGILIAIGHFTLAFSAFSLATFYGGLLLIVLGTGLLKPNISVLVGNLYPEQDGRRDAGFSLFFMGINIGALLAPLVCGYLAQSKEVKSFLINHHINPAYSWHWGFGAAGIGMVIGLIQFYSRRHTLKENDEVKDALPANEDKRKRTFKDITKIEKRRLMAILIFFLFTIIFGMISEQAGSSLNLFGDRLTRHVLLGFHFPSSWLQSVSPFYVIILAPLFSLLWMRLGHHQPSSPAKFSISLLSLGLAYLLMVAATLSAFHQGQVSPLWLMGVFFLEEIGSVILNTIGLSVFTKLAPRGFTGQVMGIWFLASAFASGIAGLIAGNFNAHNLHLLSWMFGCIAMIVLISALLLAIIKPWVKRLMGGIQ